VLLAPNACIPVVFDARIDTAGLLGLRPGDAHVIRNAGGRATEDAINAIAISQAMPGTREVMVMHHTECAMGRMSGSEIAGVIQAATGHPFHEKLDTFADPIQAVLEDLERLRRSTHLARRDRIRGFMYDLAKSAVVEVSR
jgi:carbonic anhydrase